ncbi:MAG: ABC-type transport auxiliary lipoprotein family protein [Acidobacteriota bacterium]
MIQRALVCWGLCLLSVLGCRSMPETHYYTLVASAGAYGQSAVVQSADVQGADVPAAKADAGITLGVEPFVVDPPYDQGLLVYRLGRDAIEVGFYDYHRWASPLGSLVAAAFVEGLRSSPDLAGSELAMSKRSYSAVLEGRVVTFEEIDIPPGQLVRIRLELLLQSPDGEKLWQRTLASESQVDAESATEIVDQLRRDLEGLIQESRAEIVAATRSPQDPGSSSSGSSER